VPIVFGLIHVLSIKQEGILVSSPSWHTSMNRILLPLLAQPHVILKKWFFQNCGNQCFNAHSLSPCHPVQRSCLNLQHPLFHVHTLPSCHSARRACPELQNPDFKKSKKNLLSGEKVPVRADEGWENEYWVGAYLEFLTNHHHDLLTHPD